jgi:hypothetical protein
MVFRGRVQHLWVVFSLGPVFPELERLTAMTNGFWEWDARNESVQF